ncbi:MAG: glycosyltransferase 61 family protein [Chitinophagaceae bacterium]
MKQYTHQDIDKPALTRKVNDREIGVKSVSEGIVLPLQMIPDGPRYGSGGILDNQGKFVNESGIQEEGYLKYGAPYPFDADHLDRKDETVIWFGLFFGHWGHFLMELVTRMWYLVEHYKGEKIVYISQYDHRAYMEGTFLEFMNFLGVKNEDIIRIDRPTQYKEVIIPAYAGTEFYFSNKYKSIFDAVVRNSGYSSVQMKLKDTIYLSRQNFKDSKWKDFGEKKIERSFIENGFQSVSPERLSLKEQIYFWNTAKTIVCINGTLPMNLVFCKNPIDLVVLNKTSRRHENLFNLQAAFNNFPIVYVDIYYVKYAYLVKNMGSGPFLMYSSPFLLEYFKDNGLTVKRNNIRLYPICAKFNILRFRYFNYHKYLGKVRNLKKQLFHK